MATKEERIHKKYKQLTLEDRDSLNSCLQRGLNLTDTAKYLHCDIATIKKEIDRNKEIRYTNNKNICGRKLTCDKHNVCGNSKCTHTCKRCTYANISCNDYCKEFTDEPQCKRLKHLCGVCNGCDIRTTCTLNKWYYNYSEAHKKHSLNVSQAHKGERISSEDKKNFEDFLSPLIKHGLSLEVIKAQYPSDFPYSIQTIYNWIDNRFIGSIGNLDLPRKVRYKARKNQPKVIRTYEYLEGRYYEDFEDYIANNPYEEVVEMDSVEGSNHSSFIMTLLFRKSNFMLAFKLKDHTSQSIIDTFDMIKSKIGEDVFKKAFPIILTDRGIEFSDPAGIEFNSNGEQLTKVFFCDSRQSQQKGKIEKNHEELRKICPKGFDFNSITQDELNLVLNHVNNYPRPILNNKSPYELFLMLAHTNMLTLNNSKKICFKDIILKPYLLSKKN